MRQILQNTGVNGQTTKENTMRPQITGDSHSTHSFLIASSTATPQTITSTAHNSSTILTPIKCAMEETSLGSLTHSTICKEWGSKFVSSTISTEGFHSNWMIGSLPRRHLPDESALGFRWLLCFRYNIARPTLRHTSGLARCYH